jgi:hypothetical protein
VCPRRRCALTENRTWPHLGDLLAVDDGCEHAVEQKVELVTRVALLDETVVALSFRRGSFAPPCTRIDESSRSRADSACATNGAESSSPQGVCSPCASRYHV